MSTPLNGEMLQKILLKEDVRQKLFDFVCGKFEKLRFARVKKLVFPDTETPAFVARRFYTDPVTFRVASDNERFSIDEKRRNVEYRYRRFHGEASLTDGTGNVKFFSEMREELDFGNATFESYPSAFSVEGIVPPRIQLYGEPAADLICGIVGESKRNPPRFGVKLPEMMQWFTCSEQFYLLVKQVLTMRETTAKDKTANKDWLMSGNRLMTNTFRKNLEGYKDQGIDINDSKVQERLRKIFYLLRTEYASKKWVHVYTAIMLMVVYGEIPTEHNVPNNRDAETPKMKHWSLPKNFVENFLANIGVKYDDAVMYVEEPVKTEVKKVPDMVKDFPALNAVQTPPTKAVSYLDAVVKGLKKESVKETPMTPASPQMVSPPQTPPPEFKRTMVAGQWPMNGHIVIPVPVPTTYFYGPMSVGNRPVTITVTINPASYYPTHPSPVTQHFSETDTTSGYTSPQDETRDSETVAKSESSDSIRSSESRKSWADMADEEEEENEKKKSIERVIDMLNK